MKLDDIYFNYILNKKNYTKQEYMIKNVEILDY